MPQLFDPATFSYEQAAILNNVPGQSLSATNTPEQISRAQAMTPESLTRTSEFPLFSPTTTKPYPIGTLDTPLTATPQEQKVSGLSSKLTTLMDSLRGKSAAQTSANTQFGVDEAQKSITDLSTQLTALKNEAAAIPLQMEQSLDGKGTMLTSGFNTQLNSRLRTNAIAALGVSSLLAASQGQLANAQALADKAVAQKYDPILEEIGIITKNLEIIKNDPQTSLEDKNRAQKQLEIQAQKKAAAEKAADDATEIWDLATKAAVNGSSFKPSTEFPSLASALQKISQAPTKEKALEIAIKTGLYSGGGKETSDITEYNMAKSQGFKGTFQQWVDRSSKYKGSGGGGDTAKEKQEKRDGEFEKFVKDLSMKVHDLTLSREEAKAQIKTLYPEYNENVIYDMVPDNYNL